MKSMPSFSYQDYKTLLKALLEAGYSFEPVYEMPENRAKVVYLRHDVDAFLTGWMAFPELEAKLGIKATYYIALSQYYNIFQSDNNRILSKLVDSGHEIGLHYDLTTYPEEDDEARKQLEFEVSVLGRLCNQKIRTISLHNPGKSGHDPFRSSDEYVHPHDPRYQDNLLYISDSCRSWRDESLLSCFSDTPPRRLLLLTHLEGYLDDSIVDSIEYLKHVALKEAIRPISEYFLGEVQDVYLSHPAVKAHNARMRKDI